MRQNFGRIRACYQHGLERDPSLHGKVAIRFIIEGDGSVPASGAVDAGSVMTDPEVLGCMEKVFASLSFPRPEGGVVTVVYPIMFDPGQ